MLEFSIITISTFVTILNEGVKYFTELVLKKDIKKYIPMFSVLFGVILGIIGFYLPDVDMGSNIVEAIFIGIAAGSAATGVNQIGKQLYKNDSLVNAGSLMNATVSELMDCVAEVITPVDTMETAEQETIVEESVETITEETSEV